MVCGEVQRGGRRGKGEGDKKAAVFVTVNSCIS